MDHQPVKRLRAPLPAAESKARDAAETVTAPASAGVPAASERAARKTWRLVLALAWPVLLQQSLLYAVVLSDRLIAGRYQPGDPEQHIAYQAAQTPATYLGWLIVSFTSLVSVGGTALVARFVGAGDRPAAVRVTNQSIVLAAVLGLLGTAAGLAWLEELVSLLQLRGDAAPYAVAYLRPAFVLLVFQVVELVGLACLAGAGDTRTGMCVLGGVALLNVPLAWGLFLGLGPLPRWGFEGIAWGTGFSHTLGCLAVLTVLALGRAGLRLRLQLLWPDPALLWRLLRISVPAGIDSLSLMTFQLWFFAIVNRLGDTATTAHGLALNLEAISYLWGAAFGTAAMTLVGQNLGALRPERAARSGWTAFGLGCGVMCLTGVVFFFLAPQLFGLFCPNAEQRPVIEAGVPVMRLIAFAMPSMACYIVFTYALRGAGDTRLPVFITWTGFLAVRIPLAYLLTRAEAAPWILAVFPGINAGLFGAWLAMVADIIVRGGLFLWRFASGSWQRVRV